jgi:HK97 family phage prohead protease
VADQFDAPAEFKFIDDGAIARGEFIGYGSTFGNVDLGGDIIERGAFRDTLAKVKPSDIPMLWGHDTRQPPIGKWLEIKEDDRGLMVRGQLILDVAKARDVHALMKEGALRGLSIGYTVPDGGATFERNGRIRRIKKVDLIEISVVTMPMNPRANVSRVKGNLTITDAERGLRDAGFSRSEAKAILAKGFKAISLRDAEEEADPSIAALQRLLSTIRGVS